MKTIILNNKNYELIENYKECFDLNEVTDLFTDYFDDFDYVLGDYSYSKLRLKGFYDKNNKKNKPINDISNYKDYVRNYCATECAYFLIKKQIIDGKKK